MIQFLESKVSTGHAIWAEQMNLDQEKQTFLAEQKKAKAQLNYQTLLLANQFNESESGYLNAEELDVNYFNKSLSPINDAVQSPPVAAY